MNGSLGKACISYTLLFIDLLKTIKNINKLLHTYTNIKLYIQLYSIIYSIWYKLFIVYKHSQII